MRILIQSLALLPLIAGSIVNYEDAVKLQKFNETSSSGTCPLKKMDAEIKVVSSSSTAESMATSSASFWDELSEATKMMKSQNASFTETGLYSSILKAAGKTSLEAEAKKEESSLASDIMQAASNSKCPSSNVREKELSEKISKLEEKAASFKAAKEMMEKSINSIRQQDEIRTSTTKKTSKSFSYSMEKVWEMLESYWTSIRTSWRNSLFISQSTEKSIWKSIFVQQSASLSTSTVVKDFTASWTSSCSSWLSLQTSAEQSWALVNAKILPGMGYFGFLVTQAQQSSNYLLGSSSSNTKSSTSKDFFLNVAEVLMNTNQCERMRAILNDQRFWHQGKEYKLNATTGELELAADYNLDAVVNSMTSNSSDIQPNLKSKIQLGQLIEQLFEYYYTRQTYQEELRDYYAQLKIWTNFGRFEGSPRPVMPTFQFDFENSSNTFGMELENPSGCPTAVDSMTAYQRWMLYGLGANSHLSLQFSSKRRELELLRLGNYLNEEEYQWLERLVSVFEQWTTDLDDQRDPKQKFISILEDLPVARAEPETVCSGDQVDSLINTRRQEQQSRRRQMAAMNSDGSSRGNGGGALLLIGRRQMS